MAWEPLTPWLLDCRLQLALTACHVGDYDRGRQFLRACEMHALRHGTAHFACTTEDVLRFVQTLRDCDMDASALRRELRAGLGRVNLVAWDSLAMVPATPPASPPPRKKCGVTP